MRYIESWLRGNGCVPIYNLMEDAATAEICRAQLWQWIHYGAKLDDGSPITASFFEKDLGQILGAIKSSMGSDAFGANKFERAGEIVCQLSEGEFREFLTTAAYQDLV